MFPFVYDKFEPCQQKDIDEKEKEICKLIYSFFF